MNLGSTLRKIKELITSKKVAVSRESFVRLLSGEGLEIGALQNPCPAPHLRVKYVDRITASAAREHYPELGNQPLVEVDIIDDAETLKTIPDCSQDFVIANHVIEHMANPIGALLSWSRVLKLGGRLFLAVPDKRFTFDKERDLTSIEHLESDFNAPDAQRDFEHFRDFALKVSCRVFRVKPESEADQFAKELWDQKYSIHYHVWTFDTFNNFLNHMIQNHPGFGVKILRSQGELGNEGIFVLEKIAVVN